MPKANIKLNNKNLLLILFLISICIFIAKAFFRLPISQKNIQGHGLYNFISVLQFIELPCVTYLGIYLVSKYIIKIQNISAILLALGFSLINLGLLMIDVRLHQYNFIIEQYIQNKYGSPFKIYMIAFLTITVGGFLIKISLIKSSRKSKKAR